MEFAAPRARARAQAYASVDTVLLIGIAAWSAVATASRYPAFAVASGIFFFEAVLVRVRVLANAGGVVLEPELAARVATPLKELCARAGCGLPRVVLRDDAVRVAAVRQVRGRVALVVSSRYLSRIGDRQLRAILAHEVAHLAHSDLRWAKTRGVVSLLVAVAGAIALTVAATGTLLLPMYVASIPMFAVAANLVFGAFNRRLERRADLDGAELSGDPEGLAQALSEARVFTEATRRHLYGPRPWRWLFFPLSVPALTHPAMSKRVRALEALARRSAAGMPVPGV